MTRARRIPLLAAVFALAAGGVAEAVPQSGIVRPTSEPNSPSVQLGAQLYAANCATCHGIDGSGIYPPRPGAGGIPGAGPSLRGVGALAADFYLRVGFMPLSGIHDEPSNFRVLFTDKEIRSLVSYVTSLGPGPGIPHPDPAKGGLSEGMQLYTLHCAGCHQMDAEGGYATGARIPPLQGYTATQIAEAVRIGPYLMPTFSRRQIPDQQLNSIIKFVLSLKNHDDNRGGWRIGNVGPIPEGLVTWWIAIPLLVIACMLVGRRFGKG
jgi:ubiquinol-cytochrome c reductase cytochrome c subunit